MNASPKKLIPTFLFSSILILGAAQVQNALAQATSPQTNLANGSAKPATIYWDFSDAGPFPKWLFDRIHTIDFQGLTSQMAREGQTSKNFVASFGATGALIYDYELEGKKLADFNDTGRNVGNQLLPFQVDFVDHGKYHVSFNAYSLKNMNALQNGDNAWREDGPFKILDQIDVLVFTYDQNYNYANVKSDELTIARAEFKLGILGGHSKNTYLAIKGGGSFGFGNESITYRGITHNVGGANSLGASVNSINGGLEFNTESNKGFRVNLQGVIYRKWVSGQAFDAKGASDYENALAQYKTDKSQYDFDNAAWNQRLTAYQASNPGVTPSQYALLAKDAQPVAPGAPGDTRHPNYEHNSTYARGEIEISQRLNGTRISKDSKGKVISQSTRPVRLALTGSYAAPIIDGDVFTGQNVGNVDMSKQNLRVIVVGLKLHF